MNQAIMQDLQQIRSICQQLAQNERQNAQYLAQQQGMSNMAQRETFASQQLQQCINLCNRVEQSVTRVSYGGYTNQFTSGGTGYQGGSFVGGYSNNVNAGALNQVMQADRQANTQEAGPTNFAGQQAGFYGGSYGGSYGAGASFGGGYGNTVNSAALNQVMQADRQINTQEAGPTNFVG